MQVFNDVKSIEFNVKLNGVGCVNYDGNEQKFTLKNLGFIDGKNAYNDNVKWAKKRFNNDNTFSFKQSADCIKHEMYKDEMAFTNTLLSHLPHALYRALAQPSFLMRGWVFTDGMQINRKACVSVTDSVSNVKHTFCTKELHSSSGSKGSSPKDKDDKGNTSLFFEECVGEEQYSFDGFIDLTEAQFISLDPIYDRLSVDIDGGEGEKIFMNAIKENYGEDTTIDYYYIKSSVTEDEFAERGILLNEKAVDFLTKDTLRRLLGINIWRNHASLKFDSMTAFVNYGNGEREEIKIKTIDDLNNFVFKYHHKYEKANAEKIGRNKEIYESNKQKLKDERSKNKKGKSEEVNE